MFFLKSVQIPTTHKRCNHQLEHATSFKKQHNPFFRHVALILHLAQVRDYWMRLIIIIFNNFSIFTHIVWWANNLNSHRSCLQYNAVICLGVYYEQNTSSVHLWYNRFKEGREDVNDDACPGRPSTSTTDESIEAVEKMMLDNHRITIREIAYDVGISFKSCQAIFTNVLGMKHAAARDFFQNCQILGKITSHRHRSGGVDSVQRSRFA